MEHNDESGDEILLQKVPADEENNSKEGDSNKIHFRWLKSSLKKVSNIHISISHQKRSRDNFYSIIIIHIMSRRSGLTEF